MADLRNYSFFQALRWPEGALVLTKLQADETFTAVKILRDEFSVIEFEQEARMFFQISLLNSKLVAELDLESFDGAQFAGQRLEFESKERVQQEPPHIALKAFKVGGEALLSNY